MGFSFENIGVLLKASSGKSYKLELSNLPHTVFTTTAYVSINDVEEVKAGRKKVATIWMRKPKERPLSCGAHKS